MLEESNNHVHELLSITSGVVERSNVLHMGVVRGCLMSGNSSHVLLSFSVWVKGAERKGSGRSP